MGICDRESTNGKGSERIHTQLSGSASAEAGSQGYTTWRCTGGITPGNALADDIGADVHTVGTVIGALVDTRHWGLPNSERWIDAVRRHSGVCLKFAVQGAALGPVVGCQVRSGIKPRRIR